MRLILLLLALVAVGACDRQKAEVQQGNAVAEAPVGPQKGVDRSRKGKSAPDVTFKNPEGGDISLAEFQGTPVLVNLWATWCAPCVKELPTLDQLVQAHPIDGRLGVVAISQDMGPQNSVKAFLETLRIRQLGAYHDPTMALSAALQAEVLPTTILFDAQGREVWRFVGDLDWSGPEAAKLLAEAGAGAKG
ncbi:MAG TPA: TlpA disulfide reductase family protein [Sphingomicrobium sp.]|nr:TlpA disulfide reductase family protein [Sphingomicrobium sp.]